MSDEPGIASVHVMVTNIVKDNKDTKQICKFSVVWSNTAKSLRANHYFVVPSCFSPFPAVWILSFSFFFFYFHLLYFHLITKLLIPWNKENEFDKRKKNKSWQEILNLLFRGILTVNYNRVTFCQEDKRLNRC